MSGTGTRPTPVPSRRRWTACGSDPGTRPPLLFRRNLDGEAGAGTADAILGEDPAAMRLDDLLRDRQPQARMGAELLARRTFGVEPVEDRLELGRGKAGPVVLDRRSGERRVGKGCVRTCRSRGAPGCRKKNQTATVK